MADRDPYAARIVSPAEVLDACEVLLCAGFTEEGLRVLTQVCMDRDDVGKLLMAKLIESEQRHG